MGATTSVITSAKSVKIHFRWSCPFGETLRNSRHHRVRSLIAQALREKHLTVHEEVPGIADNGSTRRIDIGLIAITPDASTALILDPTVRFEKHADQPIEDNSLEKRNMYIPTFPYYKKKYSTNSKIYTSSTSWSALEVQFRHFSEILSSVQSCNLFYPVSHPSCHQGLHPDFEESSLWLKFKFKKSTVILKSTIMSKYSKLYVCHQ